MGRALAFDYRVKLAPPEDHYRILEMHCAPAPGDTGHQFQCEYLNNAEALTRSIAGEKPLLGKPLNEVLNVAARLRSVRLLLRHDAARAQMGSGFGGDSFRPGPARK